MPILVAGMRHFDVVQNGAVVNQIKESIVANGIDVFCADPLAACHSVEENSNMAMGSVIRIFCDIAEDCDCAVELLHHPRKPNGQETEVEHARGASALIAASRSARALNVLSKDEHSKWRFTGNRRAYFKVLNGKANLTLPPDDGEIFQILTVALGNGENDAPGDLVGVVNRRYPQSAADELSEEQIRDLLAALAIGGPWREDQRATDQPWVGTVIARVLKLDISSEAGKWQVATLIKNWLETGRLVRRQLRGQNRHWHWYIEPG